MKNCLFKYKSHLATAFIGLCLVSTGCTDKFEEINTDPKGVDDSVTDMVDKIQSPLDNIIPPGTSLSTLGESYYGYLCRFYDGGE